MPLIAHVGDTTATILPSVLLVLGLLALAWGGWTWSRRRAGTADSRPLVSVGAVLGSGVLGVVGIAAFLTQDEWSWVLEDGGVQSSGVTAPAVELGPDQDRYRIGEGSSASYEVTERLAGQDRTSTGTTPFVAGEIAVDRANPANSHIGTVVVNVEAFTSDSSFRDRRIRHDFLESTAHPYVEFAPTSIAGPSTEIVDGEPYDITIVGDLTVKETTAPTTFTGAVTLDGDRLVADVRAEVLMSTYGVGPISISGLVSTGDAVGLELHLVATRVTADEGDPTLAAFTPSDGEVGVYPFSERVQPILEQRCAACHGDGDVGYATFPLETAGDAASVAADLALVTGSRYMPPWPASSASLPFAHDWSLTDDDIAAIAEWAAAGGGLDVPASAPLTADGEGVREVDPDVVLAGEPHTGNASQPDDYRCQVYAFPDSDGDRWMRSFAFLPDEEAIVHHAIIFHVEASTLAEAQELDAADPDPGWQCFGLSGLSSGATQISAWAPGQQPMDYPVGSGIVIAPGDFLVVQVHYHYDHEFPADASELAIDLASPDEIAAGGGALRPVSSRIYLAPAEIPCRADESGPMCDRGTVLARILQSFGDLPAAIPDLLLASCEQRLEDFLADVDGVADSSCRSRVQNPGQLIGLWGHMHQFGQSIRLTLNPGTAEERVLLDIPNWSFEWQLNYEPVDPIFVDADDVLQLDCTWDRSLAPMLEPRYLIWSDGTEDEMCYSTLSTIPLQAGDQPSTGSTGGG